MGIEDIPYSCQVGYLEGDCIAIEDLRQLIEAARDGWVASCVRVMLPEGDVVVVDAKIFGITLDRLPGSDSCILGVDVEIDLTGDLTESIMWP